MLTFQQLPGVTDTVPAGESVFTLANKHVAIIPQIESRLDIKNLEEIMKMEEISAFMIGSGDLRLEMGLPLGLTGNEPEFIEAVEKATKVSREADIPLLGVARGPDMVKTRIDQGYRAIVCCLDAPLLAFAMINKVEEARSAAEEHMQARSSS
ncbi:Pyruvate/Phosphoenolpyruvate kinase-like domain-containing protein [Mycena vitilis]|nr:Pyruvate/Phosphoenolpyruvate kinase-like domain-containing protein [Mycena vitilis]